MTQNNEDILINASITCQSINSCRRHYHSEMPNQYLLNMENSFFLTWRSRAVILQWSLFTKHWIHSGWVIVEKSSRNERHCWPRRITNSPYIAFSPFSFHCSFSLEKKNNNATNLTENQPSESQQNNWSDYRAFSLGSAKCLAALHSDYWDRK